MDRSRTNPLFFLFLALFVTFFVLWLVTVEQESNTKSDAYDLLERTLRTYVPNNQNVVSENKKKSNEERDGWKNRLWDMALFWKEPLPSGSDPDKMSVKEKTIELRMIEARRRIAKKRQEKVNSILAPERKYEILWPKKFVVIATKRAEPSEEIVKLTAEAKEHPSGWHVVIVALHNNSQSEDLYGRLPSTTYLTIEAQHQLPFATAEFFKKAEIAYDSYARKNFGYLYAMLEGAELIADADDTTSSIPEGYSPVWEAKRWRQLEDFEHYSEQRKKSKEKIAGLVNHYDHFGLANFTPRGYFRTGSRTTYRPWLSPRKSETSSPPPLQMGLLRKHPDFSARITQLPSFKFMNVQWNPLKDSISLAKGTFGILHSSLGFYSEEAIPTLMLPVSSGLSRAVVDVWRGFVSQRFLWAYDRQIGYVKTPIKRDINNITTEELRELDDSQIQLSELFEPLLKVLIDFEFPTETMAVWSAFELLYEALSWSGLVDDVDLKLSKAWVMDVKILSLPIPTDDSLSNWNFEEYLKSSMKERPVIAFSHNTEGKKKKFFYGTQTDMVTLPPRLSEALPLDVDLVAFNYIEQVDNMLHWKYTWPIGRNLLLQEMYVAERYHGYQYEYVLLLDDDITLHCKEFDSDEKFNGVEYPTKEDSANINDMRKCYETFQQYTIQYQPAVMSPCMNDSLALGTIHGTNDTDACYNVFHREAINQILPYNDINEGSWGSSQQFVVETARALYPHHVFRNGFVYVTNAESRPWVPRAVPDVDSIHEAVWGGMPKNVALSGGLRPAEKKRSYADVCSCDVACQASFCVGDE